MSRVTTTLLLLIGINTALCYGMECTFGNKNFISRAINSCPGLLDPEEKSYCCYDISSEIYCCGAMEYTFQSSWFALVMVVVSGLVFTTTVFCMSCLCCSCCPWYRRRHQGTVYGKVQVPSVVHIIRASTIIPQPTPHYINTARPTNSAGISQPSTHSQVIYEKQAPYNPNYPNMSSMQQ